MRIQYYNKNNRIYENPVLQDRAKSSRFPNPLHLEQNGADSLSY